MACGIGMSAESKKREAEFQVEDDLRTLKRAEEIRADGKRTAACRKAAQKQLQSLRKVAGK